MKIRGGRAAVGLFLTLLAACGGRRGGREALDVEFQWYGSTPSGARPVVVFVTEQPTGRLTITRHASGVGASAPLVDSGGAALRWAGGKVTSWAPGLDWGLHLSGPVDASVELDVRHDIEVLLQRTDSTLIASVGFEGIGSAKSVTVDW